MSKVKVTATSNAFFQAEACISFDEAPLGRLED